MERRRWIGSQQALALVNAINWIIQNEEVSFNKTSDKYEMDNVARNVPGIMLEPFEEDRKAYSEEVKASLLATYKKLDGCFCDWEDDARNVMWLDVWLDKGNYGTCVKLQLVPNRKVEGGYDISDYTVEVYDQDIDSPKKILQFIEI